MLSREEEKIPQRLRIIESALRACWSNAQDLISASAVILEKGQTGLGLSLAVLALEELGKLLSVDGLLFARNDDHKAAAFSKSMKSHSHKLEALELLPLLIGQIANFDHRSKEERFRTAIVISVRI